MKNLLTNENLLLEKYNSHLFGINKIMPFQIRNKICNGIINRVDSDGLLHVDVENEGIKKFRIKEIELLY